MNMNDINFTNSNVTSRTIYGLGLIPPVIEPPLRGFSSQAMSTPIPDSFDWRGSNYFVDAIRDQGQCGSCWAFSTVTVLSLRIGIATKGRVKVPLSVQELVSCSVGTAGLLSGCDGGQIQRAMEWLATNGTVANSLYQYEQTAPSSYYSCSTRPYTNTCPCRGNIQGTRYKYQVGTVTTLSTTRTLNPMYKKLDPQQLAATVENMKREIYLHGPIVIGILCPASLQQPDPTDGGTKVFIGSTNERILGAHAMTVVGWGNTLKGRQVDPYWIVQNSWGREWGDMGYYYHILGKNNCSIESIPHAGEAVIPS